MPPAKPHSVTKVVLETLFEFMALTAVYYVLCWMDKALGGIFGGTWCSIYLLMPVIIWRFAPPEYWEALLLHPWHFCKDSVPINWRCAEYSANL